MLFALVCLFGLLWMHNQLNAANLIFSQATLSVGNISKATRKYFNTVWLAGNVCKHEYLNRSSLNQFGKRRVQADAEGAEVWCVYTPIYIVDYLLVRASRAVYSRIEHEDKRPIKCEYIPGGRAGYLPARSHRGRHRSARPLQP